MCSVLAGTYAPIDFSDGCGMNLLNIKSREWSAPVLASLQGVAPGLARKLGPVVPSHSRVGPVSPYFVSKYGLPTSADVFAFSGDNPNSVAGLGLREPGDVAVSLGTSDTMFGITAAPTPGLEGHIFVNPVDPASYMAMLCYKNGSITRERVRNEAAGGEWATFNKALQTQPAGNGGYVGFFIDQPEITPALSAGVRRFGPDGKKLSGAFPTPAHEVRAVVEGQFMSLRVHGESIGLTSPKRLIATGGASGNPAITQVLADVFGVPVYVAAQTDSASLGAAYRALHGETCAKGGKFVTFESVMAAGTGNALSLASSPNATAHAAITKALPAYRAAEKAVLAERK
jgi:xylulokinase